MNENLSYTCSIHIRWVFLKLISLVPPVILEHPQTIVGVAGGDVTLQCNVSGYPLPSVTWWTVEGTMVDGDIESEVNGNSINSMLTLTGLDHDDVAKYYCRAKNSLAEDIIVESEQAQLTVHCKPILWLPDCHTSIFLSSSTKCHYPRRQLYSSQ